MALWSNAECTFVPYISDVWNSYANENFSIYKKNRGFLIPRKKILLLQRKLLEKGCVLCQISIVLQVKIEENNLFELVFNTQDNLIQCKNANTYINNLISFYGSYASNYAILCPV